MLRARWPPPKRPSRRWSGTCSASRRATPASNTSPTAMPIGSICSMPGSAWTINVPNCRHALRPWRPICKACQDRVSGAAGIEGVLEGEEVEDVEGAVVVEVGQRIACVEQVLERQEVEE